MAKPAIKTLVTDLAATLREEVLPHLGAHAGRAHTGAAESGDVTFQIDEHAEARMESFLSERAPEVSFFSEDRGMVSPAGDRAEWVLVVDPIDGTRPAMAGLESCCVAEIKSGTTFLAERGAGVEVRTAAGEQVPVRLSPTRDVARMFWTLGFRGRPAEPLVSVLGELIDASSVGGAVFDLGSAAFDLTRIATGQLDAYLDVGSRMIDEVPALRARFERVGGGAVLNNSPYDLAAAVLCAEEAGAIVTDATGRPLAARPLLGSGHDFQMSCVAAANRELHTAILSRLEHGFERLRAED